jgi:hypothetical protein
VRINVRRLYGLVAVATVVGILSAATAVSGAIVLSRAPVSSASFEIGKWMLQLATVFAGTGLITAVLRQVEVMRSKRESWTGQLQDVVVGQDAIEAAALRLVSNPTAETYSDLIEKCREFRATLRRMTAAPDAHDQEGLRAALKRMRTLLKPLVQEYETKYVFVVRQQLLDDEFLEFRLNELAEKNSLPDVSVLPDSLMTPLGVGKLLQDKARFPVLDAFSQVFNGGRFNLDSDLYRAYEKVKSALEKNAGVRR